jgi:hypothetical protein
MTERLEQLAAIPPRTKAAKIRPFMPAIEKRILDGVSHQAIITWLADGGIEVTLGTFKSYLQRYRRKAQTLQQPVTPIPTQASAVKNTDRNTGTDPRPMEDGDQGDTTEPGPDSEAQAERRFEDMFDRKKRAAFTDQFMNRQPLLIGRNRDKP